MAFHCDSFSKLGFNDYGNAGLSLAQWKTELVPVAVCGHFRHDRASLQRFLVMGKEKSEAESATQWETSCKSKRDQMRLAPEVDQL
jgi:hypothetical protein